MDVARFSPSNDTTYAETGTDVILVNTETDQYFALDEIGSKVWVKFAAGDSLETIVEAILEEYDVEEEDLKRDLESLQQACYEQGLIYAKD